MKSMKDVSRAKAAEKTQRFASGGAVKDKLSVDNADGPMTGRGVARNKAFGGTIDGARARSRPDRSSRKGGKGKTNVNVVIAPPPAAAADRAPPPAPAPMPMKSPAPPPPMPAPALGAPPPGAGGAPAIPGMNPLLRKRGGRVTAGAESGVGRLQKAKGGKC